MRGDRVGLREDEGGGRKEDGRGVRGDGGGVRGDGLVPASHSVAQAHSGHMTTTTGKLLCCL